MPGRTDRTNAREAIEHGANIIFEMDGARSWLEELGKRCDTSITRAKKYQHKLDQKHIRVMENMQKSIWRATRELQAASEWCDLYEDTVHELLKGS